MSNKITIIKVLPKDGKFSPSSEDLERWRKKFAENDQTALADGVASGEITVEVLPEKADDECYLTLVRVGGETFSPSFEDLENWRKLFEDAVGDPDFKIFTHPDVEIEVVPVGKIIDVE